MSDLLLPELWVLVAEQAYLLLEEQPRATLNDLRAYLGFLFRTARWLTEAIRLYQPHLLALNATTAAPWLLRRAARNCFPVAEPPSRLLFPSLIPPPALPSLLSTQRRLLETMVVTSGPGNLCVVQRQQYDGYTTVIKSLLSKAAALLPCARFYYLTADYKHWRNFKADTQWSMPWMADRILFFDHLEYLEPGEPAHPEIVFIERVDLELVREWMERTALVKGVDCSRIYVVDEVVAPPALFDSDDEAPFS